MKLHIGCGNNKLDGYINADIRKTEATDEVWDILEGIPHGGVDYIFTENFMEHIPQDKVIQVMNEMWFSLKIGGRAEHWIPLAGTVNDYQDPTHLSRWIPETFAYFEKGNKRNEYYGYIHPWKIILCEIVEPWHHTIHVILEK